MADLKIQGVVEMSSEGAERALDRVADKADQMAGTVAGSAGKAGAAIDNLGTGAGKSANEFSRAEGRISESIRRATRNIENLGKTASQRLELQISEKGFDAAKFEPALKKLREVEAAAAKTGVSASSSLNSMGLSAGQLSAALRGVPAQFTDIVTSLQSGQAPLTVLLQQGGQLKDMFGGAGNAAKALGGYVVGLISPFTIAAAAAGALGYAYYKGSSEASEFSRTLILTGNAAGTTAGQLMDMSRTVALATGATRGSVAETLNDIAGSGKVSADMLAKVTKAAVDLERTGGQSAAATAKEFASLGDAPADAILKLNDKYHFLTAAVYEQIKALQDQGRETEAAKLAQTTYADVLEDRSRQMVQNLGYVERAWKAIAGASKSAVDAVFSVGRDAGLEEQLAKAKRYAENLSRSGDSNTAEGRASNAKAQQAIADLEAQIAKQKQLTQAEAEAAKARDAQTKWSVESVKYLDKEAQKKNEILRVTNMMTEAGKSQAEIAKVIAQVDEKYAEKKSASVKALKEDYSELFGRQEQMALIAKALKAETDEIAKANADYAKSVAALLDPVEREAESLERQLDTYGLTRSEIEATTIARLEEAKALATLNGAGEDAIAFYEREIDARKRIQAAAAGIENNKAWDEAVKESKKAADKAADEWQKSSDRISDSITDALMRGFESGKDFAENLRDAVVNMFSTMVLRPVVQATVVTGLSAVGFGSAAASESGSLGSVGNLASAGSSAYNLYSGGSGLYSSFATSGLGQSLGLSALTQSTGVAASTSMGLTIPGMATEMTSLGSTVGAAIPYVGAAIAAIGLLTSALGKGGGPKTEGDAYGTLYGTTLGLSATDRTGDNWITGTNSNAVVESLLTPIGTSVAGLIKSMGGNANGLSFNLGFSTDPKGTAQDNIQSGVMDASGNYVYRNGRNAERGSYSTELQLEAQRMMVAAVKAADVSQVYKDVAGSVDLYTASAEQLQTVLSNLTAITTLRTAFDKLGLGADNLSTALIAAAGGTSTLATNLDSYYSNFYTTAERNAKTSEQVADALAAVGIAMPASKEAFRAIVEGLDLTTNAGQTVFAAMMSVSSSFATVADAADTAAASTATLADALTSAQSGLKSAYEEQSKALQSTKDQFAGFAASLKSFRQSLLLGDLSPLDANAKYAEAKSQFNDVSKRAQLGDTSAIEQLQSVSEAFLNASRGVFASGDAYNSDFAAVVAATEGTESLATRQARIADESLTALKSQVSVLIDIDDSVQTVTAAIGQLALAIANMRGVGETSSTDISTMYQGVLGRQASAADTAYWANQAKSMTGSQLLSSFVSAATAPGNGDATAANAWALNNGYGTPTDIAGMYSSILGRSASASDLAYWQGMASSMSSASLLTSFLSAATAPGNGDAATAIAWAKRHKIPGYASGGIASGLFMAGEGGGPELIYSPAPVRVLSNAQTRAAMSGGNDEEIRALREEIRQLRADQAAQHRESMEARYDAADRAASKVVDGQKEVAWRESSKSRYAA